MALVLRTRKPCAIETVQCLDDYDINHPLVEICLTPSAGLGLFAKQDIQRGTRILSEASLVTDANSTSQPLRLWSRLNTLTRAQLNQFDSLHCNQVFFSGETRSEIRKDIVASGKFYQCPELLDGFVDMEVHRHGIFDTNSTTMGPGHGLGVFALYSRVNHSCTPNTHGSYNHSLGRHTLQAIRDIKAGEEIVTGYVDCAQPLFARTADLKLNGVNCYCPCCMKSPIAIKSEKSRKELFNISLGLEAYCGDLADDEDGPEAFIPHNPKEALQKSEEKIALLQGQGLVGVSLAKACRETSRFCLKVGMVEKAKAYARKEAEVELYCLGVETQYLNHGQYGGSAEHWMKQIDSIAVKEQVKIRMCEKRCEKEKKKADKKAAKKAAKR